MPPIPDRTSNVAVTWKDGSSDTFLAFWLRDHCPCTQCRHPDTQQRLVDTFAIPLDVTAADVQVDASKDTVVITWPDHHKSMFDGAYLRKHSYSRHANPALAAVKNDPCRSTVPLLWHGPDLLRDGLPTVPYDAVMTTDHGVLAWLRSIGKYGLGFVEGCPATPAATEALIRRISRIRETFYGGFWDFTSDLAHADTAYTNLELHLHTDTTYFTEPMGLQVFHLLEHDGTGGESTIMDGFKAAETLKRESPWAFDALASIRVPSAATGETTEHVRPSPCANPILTTDPATGHMLQVRYNNDDRRELSHLPSESVAEFYAAYRAWQDVLRRDNNGMLTFKLKPGTVLAFDNWRVLHGRTSFTGRRRMSGAYIGRDDWQSRWRVLEENA